MNIQVEKSGEYVLSYEPSHTGTSGKIEIQASLVRSLLGIDEVILIVAGFAGSSMAVLYLQFYFISKRRGKRDQNRRRNGCSAFP
jgi:hypothetical protein